MHSYCIVIQPYYQFHFSEPKPSTTETAIEPETQNRLPTLKRGETVRIRTGELKIWDKKGSVIARNDRPRLYNVLNKNDNLIFRNRHHSIPITKKLFVKHNYENILKPSKTISQKTITPPRTDTPSNILAPSVRT